MKSGLFLLYTIRFDFWIVSMFNSNKHPGFFCRLKRRKDIRDVRKKYRILTHVRITKISSIVHLYCGAWPRPGKWVIKKGTFRDMKKKHL